MLFASLSFSSFLLNGEPQPPPPALSSDLRSPTLPAALPTTIQWGLPTTIQWGFPSSSVGKASACNAGAPGSIPGSGRSPREGNGSPLQILACRIPWREEPGGLQSMGSQRVRHDWATNTHTHTHIHTHTHDSLGCFAYSNRLGMHSDLCDWGQATHSSHRNPPPEPLTFLDRGGGPGHAQSRHLHHLESQAGRHICENTPLATVKKKKKFSTPVPPIFYWLLIEELERKHFPCSLFSWLSLWNIFQVDTSGKEFSWVI